MKKSKFFKTKFYSLYICKAIGYLWFRLFNLNLSIKNLKKYDFKGKTPKGVKIGHWIITKIN